MAKRRISVVDLDGSTAYRVVFFRRHVDEDTAQVDTVVINEEVLTLARLTAHINRQQNRLTRWQDVEARINLMIANSETDVVDTL